MAWIEIKAEFGLVTEQLRRIADALERAYPMPVMAEKRRRPVDVRDVSVVTNEKLWDLEQEE